MLLSFPLFPNSTLVSKFSSFEMTFIYLFSLFSHSVSGLVSFEKIDKNFQTECSRSLFGE